MPLTLSENILDGKSVAESELESLRKTISDQQLEPSLHVIYAGDDEASRSYIGMKEKKADQVGITTRIHDFPSTVSQAEVTSRIKQLNQDKNVNGVIVQLPLPEEHNENRLLETVHPKKDVDGLNPVNFGKLLGGTSPYFSPPTPRGILKLLEAYDVSFRSNNYTLVGMGKLVGRPLSQMLLNRDATVLCLNKYTPELSDFTRKADVIVVGTGKPGLIKEKHVSPGTVVVDAGIHRIDGELVGDVKFEQVKDVARLITPVPGGVGPLTVSGLLANTLEAEKKFAGDISG